MKKKDKSEFIDEVSTFIEFSVDNIELYKLTAKEDEKYLLYDILSKNYQICNSRSLSATLLMKITNKDIYFSSLKRKDMVDLLIENNLVKEIYDIGYEPTNKHIYDFNNKNYFNIFKPSKFEIQIIKENNFNNKISITEGLKIYNFKWIQKLIYHLIGKWDSDLKISENPTKLQNEWEEKITYFYEWFAFIIQNPTRKLKTGLTFQGTQSTGKGLFKEIVLDNIFGGDNVKYISQNVLEGKFSNFLEKKRLVVANEIQFNYKSSTYEQLKFLMSDQRIDVEGKNKDTYSIQNFTHWIFFTNNENPLRIEENDTRHTVFYQENVISDEIVDRLTINVKSIENELFEFLKFLNHINVDIKKVRVPLETSEKQKIKEFHKDDITRFIEWCQENGSFENCIGELNLKNDEKYNLKNKSIDKEFISNSLLYELYILYCKNKNIRISRQEQSFQQQLGKKYKFRSKTKWISSKNKAENFRYKSEIFFNISKEIFIQINKNNKYSLKSFNEYLENKNYIDKKKSQSLLNELIKSQVVTIKNQDILPSINYVEKYEIEIVDLSNSNIIMGEVKQ